VQAPYDQELHDFLALLAHELRNPLGALRNGLSVMQLAAHDPQAVGRAQQIMERQVAHMVRLIDDSLDVSRLKLNKMQLTRGRVSLAEIVASAVELARSAIEGADHQLEVALPAEPLLLDADATRLAQVFGNLLSNAARYTPRHGQLALRAERQGDLLTVSVSDNGVGLRPESLRSIFSMYSQADHGAERRTAGLGIGLALVRGLTERHGGTVHAESEGVGKGSRFVVSLPGLIVEESAAPPSPARARHRKPRRRILIADDSLDALESTATLLRLAGNEVYLAHDGLDAVARAEQLQPDVVLMDLAMPELDGFEATRHIRSQDWGRGMIVIALTGLARESERRQSRLVGCDEHLVKPVSFEVLSETIDELCTRPSGARLRSAAVKADVGSGSS
jgi:CheY-like chemotaxis protein